MSLKRLKQQILSKFNKKSPYKVIENDYYEKLSNKYGGKVLPYKRRYKNILVIADTHGRLKFHVDDLREITERKRIDICVLLGDIFDGTDFDIIFNYLPENVKIIGIKGNHDEDDVLKKNNIIDIDNKVIEIEGIKFAGMEGCVADKENRIGPVSEAEGFYKYENLEYADILISHAPPYRTTYHTDKSHIGSKYISDYIYKHNVPICIHGHTHEVNTKTLSNGTIIYETYMVKIIEV